MCIIKRPHGLMFWPVKSHRVYLFACLFIHLEDLKKLQFLFCLQEILQWFYLLALIEQIWCNMVYLTKACSCFHVLFYLYRIRLMSHVSSVVSFSSIGNSQWIRDFAGTNLLSKGISLSLSWKIIIIFFCKQYVYQKCHHLIYFRWCCY